jgi:hypothetical protein
MARNETKGTKQVGQAVDAELWDEFTEFCRDRGDTIRHHLEIALRRHLDNPPPPPPAPPPLPPYQPGGIPRKGRKR